jgi:hypothetical protein
MRAPIATFVCILLLTLFAYGNSPVDGKLTGTITDEQGASIPNAYIIVRRDPIGTNPRHESTSETIEDVNVHSDPRGEYSIVVSPGVYDVFVSSPGFYPSCGKIRVQDGREANFNSKLKISTMLSIRVD